MYSYEYKWCFGTFFYVENMGTKHGTPAIPCGHMPFFKKESL